VSVCSVWVLTFKSLDLASEYLGHSATDPSYNKALITTSIKLINPSYFNIVCPHPGWLCYVLVSCRLCYVTYSFVLYCVFIIVFYVLIYMCKSVYKLTYLLTFVCQGHLVNVKATARLCALSRF